MVSADPAQRGEFMTAETAPAIPADVEEEGNKTATERLVFFSDAVIAIAITLLALELPIPTGDTPSAAWSSFGDHLDEYLSFLISFVVIANQWFAHHAIYRYVTRVHRRVAGVNMGWLLTVVVTPFATRVLVGDTSFPMAFTLYAGVQIVGQLAMLSIILMIRHDHLIAAEVPLGTFNRSIARTIAFATSFAVSIPVAYHSHWAFALWAATPFLVRLVSRVQRRHRRREGQVPAERSKPAAS
jgi:uncharacterized membrane protein